MTNETRTVLCGVDGSEQSVRAAQVAHALANALEAHLVLAYVSPGGVRPLPVTPAAAYVAEQDVEPDLAVLSDTAARAGLTGVRTRRVEAGSATEGLVAAARVEFPHLIVVGASGHSTVREALLGSVAGELPSKAPCPVVVTPREAVIPEATRTPASDRSVVCGIADAPEAEPVARTAGQLAQALDARLILVHARLALPPPGSAVLSRHSLALADTAVVEREQRVALDLLEHAAEWSGQPDRAEIASETGEPAERIQAIADRENAELIVVGSRGRGPLRAAVLGSTSRTLAASATQPVAVVGQAAEA